MRIGERLANIVDWITFNTIAVIAGDFDIPPIREEISCFDKEERQGARAEGMGRFDLQTESLWSSSGRSLGARISQLSRIGPQQQHSLIAGKVRSQGLGYIGDYRKIE
jgi:hypothetical protein